MKINFLHYDLLSIPVDFRLSWGKLGYSRHVYVTLAVNDVIGFGEGVLYKTTQLTFEPFISHLFSEWTRENDFETFADAREAVARFADFEPALAFAFDTALWDIEGKIKKVPVYKLLGGKKRSFEVVEEIFIEDDTTTDSQLSKIINNGTRVVKLKVGQNPVTDSAKVLRIKKFNSAVQIRPDANRGYSFSDAMRFIDLVGPENLNLFEEPINGGLSQLSELKVKTGVKLMLDESITSVDQLKSASDQKALDVFNLKLTRVGGITRARDFIEVCTKKAIPISMGCNEETEVGMAAILHLAGSLENLYGVEGVGADRIHFHSSKNHLSIKNGYLFMTPGSGLTPDFFLSKVPPIYQNESMSNRSFLAREFVGIWKTRVENVLLKLWKK